jgi:hypothetical protein
LAIKLNDVLFNTLCMKGFSNKWCEWINSFIQGGTMPECLISVMANTLFFYSRSQ